jgi:hypothetical protein
VTEPRSTVQIDHAPTNMTSRLVIGLVPSVVPVISAYLTCARIGPPYSPYSAQSLSSAKYDFSRHVRVNVREKIPAIEYVISSLKLGDINGRNGVYRDGIKIVGYVPSHAAEYLVGYGCESMFRCRVNNLGANRFCQNSTSGQNSIIPHLLRISINVLPTLHVNVRIQEKTSNLSRLSNFLLCGLR